MTSKPAASTPSSDTALSDTQKPAADSTPAFGWTTYAERINGRFAMVGFVALLLLELVTGQTFIRWLGF
jgi:hypothetical protein